MTMGIYFKKLEIIGPDKQPATLKLDRGLNVLSGASDTGKSYVVECINYILGGNKQPKDVEEAHGYNEIRAELSTYDGRIFSITRKLKDPKIYLVEDTLEIFGEKEQKKLSAKHDPNSDDNLSSYLLDILGLKGKKLKTNARNEKRTISFRDCAHFSVIDEEKIITSSSPIYTGVTTSETVEDSLFRLLLSGKDDDDLETIDDPKIAKSKINGRIAQIDEIVERKRKEINDLKTEIEAIGQNEINLQIDELSKLVDEANKSVLKEEEKRQEIWKQISSYDSELKHINELSSRFNLLREHYDSDIRRLEFINEGQQFIEQLKDSPCPICGTMVNENELPKIEDSEKIEISLRSEYQKIHKKREDLSRTLSELRAEHGEVSAKLNDARAQFSQIDTYINDRLKPVYEFNAEKLSKYLSLKGYQTRIDNLSQEVFNLLSDKKYYNEKLKEKQQVAQGKALSQDIYDSLANVIKDIITSWDLSCETVYYDKTKNDIEIDGKARGNFGKGYRAIYLTAFMIGVMKYCRDNNLKHPFFLVLDSPLISFKERDADPDEEILPEEIKNTFFRALADLENLNAMQIFVIDNKEQPQDINDKCTFEHFSRNNNHGRYGLFPTPAKND